MALSRYVENQKSIDKTFLFQLLVDNYSTGTGSYESCEKFYVNYLSDLQKKNNTISYIYDTLNRIKASKENYAIATNYYEHHSLLKSYQYYSLVVIEDYEHYHKSVGKKKLIEATLVKEIEHLASKGKLDEANTMIDEMYGLIDMPVHLDMKLQRYFDSGGMNAEMN